MRNWVRCIPAPITKVQTLPFQFCIKADSTTTSSYYVYKASYSIPHLELPEDPVLYGISVGSIKQYEQGYVYTTDQLSTQAITTYGVAEPVADAIIDGSIDEFKAEVQKGVTDGTL